MQCKNCHIEMTPDKKINKLWLIVWGVLFCPIGILYAITRKAKFCPGCGADVYK